MSDDDLPLQDAQFADRVIAALPARPLARDPWHDIAAICYHWRLCWGPSAPRFVRSYSTHSRCASRM